MNVPPIWQPPQLSRLTGEGPPPVTWTASANAPARRPRPRQAKPPLRAPPSPRATSPRAEPPPAALAPRAARPRLGPRTPPSGVERRARSRRLEPRFWSRARTQPRSAAPGRRSQGGQTSWSPPPSPRRGGSRGAHRGRSPPCAGRLLDLNLQPPHGGLSEHRQPQPASGSARR